MRAAPIAAAAILVALGMVPPTHADEGTAPSPPPPALADLALTWEAPAGCPGPNDVKAQFLRLLRSASHVRSGKHITATAAVRMAANGRWILDLSTVFEGTSGQRSLSGNSCTSVASATALILALMIDPIAAESAFSEGPVAPQRPPPSAAAPPVAAAPASPPPSPHRLYARAFGGGVFNLLPSPAPVAGLAIGATWRRFGGEFSFLATPEQRATVEVPKGAGGDLRLLAGGARGCRSLGDQAVVWQACLGAEVERVTGRGVGADPPQHPVATMLAGTGGLLLSLPLSAHVALMLDVSGAIRTYRPTFILDRTGGQTATVFTVPAGSASVAMGLALGR